jgi:hypothetical protein
MTTDPRPRPRRAGTRAPARRKPEEPGSGHEQSQHLVTGDESRLAHTAVKATASSASPSADSSQKCPDPAAPRLDLHTANVRTQRRLSARPEDAPYRGTATVMGMSTCINIRTCPAAAMPASAAQRAFNWRPGRVYFLTLLESSRDDQIRALSARPASHLPL